MAGIAQRLAAPRGGQKHARADPSPPDGSIRGFLGDADAATVRTVSQLSHDASSMLGPPLCCSDQLPQDIVHAWYTQPHRAPMFVSSMYREFPDVSQ